jgi:hypothetical protein
MAQNSAWNRLAPQAIADRTVPPVSAPDAIKSALTDGAKALALAYCSRWR